MRRIRLAILGDSPCDHCMAACCKQNGHEFAAILRDGERQRFAAFAIDVSLNSNGRVVYERVLPYRNGRCTFLDDDDRCSIYDDRPSACRQFQCVTSYNESGIGQHGEFLARNPRVLEMLNSM